jgi:malate dehydrogenase
MKAARITIAGAGSVGASSAAFIAARRLGRVFLFDIVADLAAGRAMDINQASASVHTDAHVKGSDSPEILSGSDIVVVTAGIARHAGMSRLDLLKKNLEIVGAVARSIEEYCPRAKVLLVTNPVDVLTRLIADHHPDLNIFGLGCSLDSLRFRFFMAESAGVSVECCQGMVMGAHNDGMIPLTRHASISGLPLREILDEVTIGRIVERTRVAGTAIVQKLKDHSGYYAAAHSVAAIVESLAFNRREIFPLSVIPNGEYGYRGIPLALPSVVDESGVRRIIEISLDKTERARLEDCAAGMEEVIRKADHSLACSR